MNRFLHLWGRRGRPVGWRRPFKWRRRRRLVCRRRRRRFGHRGRARQLCGYACSISNLSSFAPEQPSTANLALVSGRLLPNAQCMSTDKQQRRQHSDPSSRVNMKAGSLSQLHCDFRCSCASAQTTHLLGFHFAPVVQQRQHHTIGAPDQVSPQIDAASLVDEACHVDVVLGIVHAHAHCIRRRGHRQSACVRQRADCQGCIKPARAWVWQTTQHQWCSIAHLKAEAARLCVAGCCQVE